MIKWNEHKIRLSDDAMFLPEETRNGIESKISVALGDGLLSRIIRHAALTDRSACRKFAHLTCRFSDMTVWTVGRDKPSDGRPHEFHMARPTPHDPWTVSFFRFDINEILNGEIKAMQKALAESDDMRTAALLSRDMAMRCFAPEHAALVSLIVPPDAELRRIVELEIARREASE